LLVGEDDVARAVRIRQRGEADAPYPSVGDPLVMDGGEIERRLETPEIPIDARGLGALGEESVAGV
jgi:hypothetical protein